MYRIYAIYQNEKIVGVYDSYDKVNNHLNEDEKIICFPMNTRFDKLTYKRINSEYGIWEAKTDG